MNGQNQLLKVNRRFQELSLHALLLSPVLDMNVAVLQVLFSNASAGNESLEIQ